MKSIMKKGICAAASLALLACAIPAPRVYAASSSGPMTAGDSAAAGLSAFVDVPQDSWARAAIGKALDYGLMKGQDNSHFGYEKPMTKAEFVTILCNMMKWTAVTPSSPSFSDTPANSWAYPYVETALAHGVMDKSPAFAPDSGITREQAAVMFVRALGLTAAASLEENSSLPFTDVTADKGFIAVAKNIGMISGTSASTFSPAGTATREQVASMLTQVYAKYYGKTDFLHAFYAISSYSQKELTKDMDAVTFMWSAMTLDGKGPWLNTGADNNNLYKIPDGYEDILSYVDENGTTAHLGVYMDVAGGAKDLLTSSENRAAAVNAIIDEITRIYPETGDAPYDGVTIDFEGLKGAEAKQGLNEFLTELSAQLKSLNKTLYVAVQPAMPDGVYYDGFDFKTIGELADKVILMAHDYAPTSLEGYTGTEWYKNAALTPIGQVYFALKAAADPAAGVADKSKLTLAFSFTGTAWRIGTDGKLLSTSPVSMNPQTVATRLSEAGTAEGFSAVYRNPYMTCTGSDGNPYFVWYEDSQSVFEKAALARMFGAGGVSLWRLGNIPNYPGYNVTDSYK